jgi:nicotinamide-nucleotide amidase
MRAEIISVGTEILLGSLVDTNAAFIAEKMASLGISISRISTVGDNWQDLYQALEEALGRVDLIVISGGLGPTEDDITKEVLSRLMGENLVLDEATLAEIRGKFSNLRIPEKAVQKQAMIPASAKRISNPVGTAPGIILEKGDKTIILLPGVPREMKMMMKGELYPYLLSRLGTKELISSRTLKVWGMGESQVNQKISDIILRQSNPKVGLLAKRGEVHISITGKFPPEVVGEKIKTVEDKIRERLGSSIWGMDEETLEGVVARLLKKRGLRIAVAESCTGGLVSHRLTNIPGSSDYFSYGIIAYSNQAKSIFLGVSASLIEKKGAVSPQVAKKMAQGVRKAERTDLGLGITGIAGPSGGSRKKPVGLVYIALSSSEGEILERFILAGNREDIKWKASQGALGMLRSYLMGEKIG